MVFRNLAALDVGEALDAFFNLGNLLFRLNMVCDEDKIEAILRKPKPISSKLSSHCIWFADLSFSVNALIEHITVDFEGMSEKGKSSSSLWSPSFYTVLVPDIIMRC